jgi:hypothetical protein
MSDRASKDHLDTDKAINTSESATETQPTGQEPMLDVTSIRRDLIDYFQRESRLPQEPAQRGALGREQERVLCDLPGAGRRPRQVPAGRQCDPAIAGPLSGTLPRILWVL